jgi:hypothetical protein
MVVVALMMIVIKMLLLLLLLFCGNNHNNYNKQAFGISTTIMKAMMTPRWQWKYNDGRRRSDVRR